MTDVERLASIETTVGHLREDVRDIARSLDLVEVNIVKLVTQRDEAEKTLSRWKTAGLSVCSGLALVLIAWLAHIALVVQAARVQP